MSKLGEAIKARRIERGWTQGRAAQKCGLGRILISRLEQGRARYLQSMEIMLLDRVLFDGMGGAWELLPKPLTPGKRWIPVEEAAARDADNGVHGT